MHGAWAKGANAYTRPPEFGTKRFGKACDVGFGRRVNRKMGNRKKSSGRTDVQNTATPFCDHLRKQATSDCVRATMFNRVICWFRIRLLVAKSPLSPSPALLIR